MLTHFQIKYFSLKILMISNHYLIKYMISREGDYYVCEGKAQPLSEQKKPEPQDEEIEVKGNIKDRLALMKERVEQLKKQKQETTALQKPRGFLEHYQEPQVDFSDFEVNLEIPEQILEIQQRVGRLQEKIVGYQIYKQRTDKKGTVIQRVKTLQKKMQDMIKAKSNEVIMNSIIQYSTNLDEREGYLKQLFLYDVYTKTQGLNEELNILEGYLQNLSKIQRTVNSAVPVPTLVKDHNEIVSRTETMRARSQKLFNHMKGEYQALLKEIDAIQV